LSILSKRLSRAERDTLLSLARAAMPAGNLFPAPGEEAVDRLEAFLAQGPAASLAGIRALIGSFDAACRARHLRRFSRLSTERQLAFVHEQQALPYPLRMGIRALLTLMKVSHYNDEEKFNALGVRYRAGPSVVPQERWMQKITDGSQFTGDREIEADVVVVGTGAGGAVTAMELARQGLAVVLLEEGRYFSRSDFTGRPLDMQMLLYRLQGYQASVGNVTVFCPTGRTVGGSTTVNSGTCMRAPDRWLKRWREQVGLRDFTPEHMDELYRRVEGILEVEPGKPEFLGGNARVIARGADALGYSHGPLPRNAPHCDGQGFCAMGCPQDAKRSTNVSYIPEALKSNAYLYTGIEVSRVLTKKGRAVGVKGRSLAAPHHWLTVKARAVVLACGTFHTPVLLQRNRLADRSGQVGRNLTIHPCGSVGALFDERIDGWNAIPQGYSINHFQSEDLQFEGAFMPPDMLAVVFDPVGPDLTEMMERYRDFSLFGFMIAETSRGRVRRLAGNFPLIQYSMNGYDWARVRNAFEILCEVYLAAGARKLYLPVNGFPVLRNRDDLDRFRAARLQPSDADFSAFHPLGTCRMGSSADRSVVGPTLETWDVENLYITDGSVVPTPLAANPQLTIMALATHASRHIAARLG
jgi:choline dehydrogenase-like flavoprotein